MLRQMCKVVMALTVGFLLVSTSATDALAKGKPKGQKKVVVHKEVVASPHQAYGRPVVVHNAHGRPPMFRPMHVVIPRMGFQWVPGHWTFDERFLRWTWEEGRYIRVRHGYRYEAGYWAETNRGLRWVDARWIRAR